MPWTRYIEVSDYRYFDVSKLLDTISKSPSCVTVGAVHPKFFVASPLGGALNTPHPKSVFWSQKKIPVTKPCAQGVRIEKKQTHALQIVR